MIQSLGRGVLHLVALAAALLSTTAAFATSPSSDFAPPKRYYLALGDSLPYGFQLDKALAGLPPEAFNTGFVDHFSARLRAIRPTIATINYSCPGESSGSFVEQCVWRATGHLLHDDYPGSQMDAALAFLRTHRGKVSPITLSLNGNDIGEFIRSCPAGDLDCITNGAPAAIAAYRARMLSIVRQLRSAAPEAEFILTGNYDPNVGAFAFADPLWMAVNDAEASVASATRARFADPFPTFNPQGNDAIETATICALTLVCTRQDPHPSDQGYLVFADIIWDASGYEGQHPWWRLFIATHRATGLTVHTRHTAAMRPIPEPQQSPRDPRTPARSTRHARRPTTRSPTVACANQGPSRWIKA